MSPAHLFCTLNVFQELKNMTVSPGWTLQLIRELKQQRRRWQRKRHFTREYALLQTLSSLFHLVQFVKCSQIFLELIMKDCIEIEEKNKNVSRLCSRPPQNVKLGTFTWYSRVVTAKKCTRKRDARAKLLFCRSNLLLFCRSRCRPGCRCLSFLLLPRN